MLTSSQYEWGQPWTSTRLLIRGRGNPTVANYSLYIPNNHLIVPSYTVPGGIYLPAGHRLEQLHICGAGRYTLQQWSQQFFFKHPRNVKITDCLYLFSPSGWSRRDLLQEFMCIVSDVSRQEERGRDKTWWHVVFWSCQRVGNTDFLNLRRITTADFYNADQSSFGPGFTSEISLISEPGAHFHDKNNCGRPLSWTDIINDDISNWKISGMSGLRGGRSSAGEKRWQWGG